MSLFKSKHVIFLPADLNVHVDSGSVVENLQTIFTHSFLLLLLLLCPDSAHQSSGSLLSDLSQPEITVTEHHHSSESWSLAPLVEQEGEAYLEKAGGVRRHTVANVHSDV